MRASRIIRPAALALAASVLAGCWVPRQQREQRERLERAQLRAIRAADSAATLTVRLAKPPADVVPRVVALMNAHALTVASAEGGVVTANVGRVTSAVQASELTARAYVVPDGPGTRVDLRGEERVEPTALLPGGTKRIGPAARGGAGVVWRALTAVADSLRADSAAAAAPR